MKVVFGISIAVGIIASQGAATVRSSTPVSDIPEHCSRSHNVSLLATSRTTDLASVKVQNLGIPEDEAAAKKFWDKQADPQFQHLDRTYVQESNGKYWDLFLPRLDWRGQRVLDYGIGGGYLGEALFKNHGIGSYVGIDISEKPLDLARNVLSPWSSKVTLRLTPVQFVDLKPDVVVCQQVIQHFPTVEYLEEFLVNVDNSGAKQLMLQFRESKDGKTTAPGVYRGADGPGQGDVAMALLTSKMFLLQHLKNYQLAWTEESPMCCDTTAMFTGWELRT